MIIVTGIRRLLIPFVAIDDYRRFRTDKEANLRRYRVVRDHGVHSTVSQDIRVGDIVFVQENMEFPCDMVLLSSSGPIGSCYVQTANIDGETDLKTRVALPETAGFTSDEDVCRLMCEVQCSQPNSHVYQFDAALRLNARTPSDTLHSLSAKQLLLQGTFLKNTDSIYGLVVYTGNETKLGMNKSKPKTKWTAIDRKIDRASRFVFLFQLIVVIVFGVVGNLYANNKLMQYWYLDLESENRLWFSPIVIPMRMLLLLSFMIPISLKVSLDLAKFIGATFIDWVGQVSGFLVR